MLRMPGLVLVLCGGLALTACSADTGPRPPGRTRDSGTRPPGPMPEGSAASCVNGIDDDADGLADCDEPDCSWLPACGGSGDAGMMSTVDSGFMGCDGIRREAMNTVAPIDIIWVIESSGSMDGEARLVQDNMNRFAAAISASGIDYHVIVITDPSFVTVPPPLGTDPARYLFINQGVGSNAALQTLIAQYPAYMHFLGRPGGIPAITHFVVVTDDESDLDAGSFQTMMEGLLGHTFDAHAVASPDETHSIGPCPFCVTEDGCTGPGGDAADIGRQYITLTAATGGQFFSICTENWTMLFDTLAAAVGVPMPLPCAYEIPPPPPEMTFDRNRVNVLYTPGGSTTGTIIPYIPGGSGACPPTGGWYYDNPDAPMQILLCPGSCDIVSMDTTGTVDIQLGCETVIF
jgi:hypothetical protein